MIRSITFRQFVLLILVLFLVKFLYNRNNLGNSFPDETEPKNAGSNGQQSSCEAYRQSCFSLYKKLRNPDPKTLFRPPLKKGELPQELYNAFIPNGEMAFGKDFYINEVYSDATSVDKDKSKPVDIEKFNIFREKVRNWKPLVYSDTALHKKMDEYKDEIKSKSMVS